MKRTLCNEKGDYFNKKGFDFRPDTLAEYERVSDYEKDPVYWKGTFTLTKREFYFDLPRCWLGRKSST